MNTKNLEKTMELVDALVNGIQSSSQAVAMFTVARTWLIANDKEKLAKLVGGTTVMLKTQGVDVDGARGATSKEYAELEKRVANLEHLMVYAPRPSDAKSPLVRDTLGTVSNPFPPFAMTNDSGLDSIPESPLGRYVVVGDHTNNPPPFTGQHSIVEPGNRIVLTKEQMDAIKSPAVGTYSVGVLTSNAPTGKPIISTDYADLVNRPAPTPGEEAPSSSHSSSEEARSSLIDELKAMMPIVESVIKESGGAKGIYTLSAILNELRDLMGTGKDEPASATMGQLMTSIDRIGRLRSRLGSHFVTGAFKSPEDMVNTVKAFIAQNVKDNGPK